MNGTLIGKQNAIRDAIRARTGHIGVNDLCVKLKLSKSVVESRLGVLKKFGTVEAYWLGEKGPYYRSALS